MLEFGFTLGKHMLYISNPFWFGYFEDRIFGIICAGWLKP
jgi:hypothetical protein